MEHVKKKSVVSSVGFEDSRICLHKNIQKWAVLSARRCGRAHDCARRRGYGVGVGAETEDRSGEAGVHGSHEAIPNTGN